jgi:hypothetical protein
MRSIFRLACFSFVVAALILVNEGFGQQQQSAPPSPINSKVAIWAVNDDGGYRVPESAVYAELRGRLKKRGVLEEYSRFLAPLRLPYTLRVAAGECGSADASPFYNRDAHAIVMCYEFMKWAENKAETLLALQKEKPEFLPMPATRGEFLTGVFVGVIMHETGHAVFDLLDVPVFGREEDAADQMAVFIALQFDKNVARTIVKGLVYSMLVLDNPPTKAPVPSVLNPPLNCSSDPFCAYSDTHGAPAQRLYNTLCLAYGADNATFGDFVEKGWLAKERAEQCRNEYQQVKSAFAKTVYPFIDPGLMQQVLAHKWFMPGDTK